jgi:hypothetical protein
MNLRLEPTTPVDCSNPGRRGEKQHLEHGCVEVHAWRMSRVNDYCKYSDD